MMCSALLFRVVKPDFMEHRSVSSSTRLLTYPAKGACCFITSNFICHVIWNITRHNTCTTTYFLVNHSLNFLFMPFSTNQFHMRFDKSFSNCRRCLFFFYCKSNAWGCFQSYRVFRNKPEYRQSSYSTKSRAVGLQRHLVFMYLCTMVCSKMSLQNWRLRGTITKGFGTKDTLRFLNIICFMTNSTQSPRMVLVKLPSLTY